ncbi:MAG: hypothetical protein R3F41_08390 [Gammaproteobacteria bacterium]|nr:hypothetical protein [Pseudomonadales bacterium]MCP5347050.1 hypothetical protein [Pseudomonadales bacterium]
MSEDSKLLTRRRRFLTGVGVVATGATLAATARAAENHQHHHEGSGFTPARHELDAWMDVPGVTHRAFIDSSSGRGGADALNYANNILLGNRDAYGGSDSDYGLIVCFRHMATPLGYNDVIWEKYGESLSRATGLTAPGSDAPLSVNPMNIEQAAYGNRGNTLKAVAARGVQFALCNKATQSIAGMLARASGSSAEEVYQELIANNIPDSRFVPAGVLAATRAQEYGYSFLFAAG